RYRDPVGPGETAASGVEVDSLRVEVDDVDRTALFTHRSDEAAADWPPDQPLAEGVHRLRATVRDRAGNAGSAASQFRVDLTRPALAIVEPPGGAYLPTRTPALRLRYQDDAGLDLTSLQVIVDGVDRTSLFSPGPAEAVASLSDESALPEGANQVFAPVRDLAGNEATAAISSNVDVRPPRIAIAQPLAGARLGASDVEAIVQYADDQALAIDSFQVSVDG